MLAQSEFLGNSDRALKRFNFRSFLIVTPTEQNTTDASAANILSGRRSSRDVEFQIGILITVDVLNIT